MSAKILLFFFCYLFMVIFVTGSEDHHEEDNDDVTEYDAGDEDVIEEEDQDLIEKTVELKRLDLKIAKLHGLDVDENDIAHVAKWGDIKMTTELYTSLKKQLDKEYEAAKHHNASGHHDRRHRNVEAEETMAEELPDNKWSLPLKYTTTHLKKHKEVLKVVLDSMKEIQQKTGGCIKFQKADLSSQESYIQFIAHDYSGSAEGGETCGESYVGKQIKANPVKIGLSKSCMTKETVLHETLHSLGFGHPFQRKDRNKYITVHEENLAGKDCKDQFELMNFPFEEGGAYDFRSVMQYEYNACAKDNLPAMTPKTDPENNKKVMGKATELSSVDVAMLKHVYCNGPKPTL